MRWLTVLAVLAWGASASAQARPDAGAPRRPAPNLAPDAVITTDMLDQVSPEAEAAARVDAYLQDGLARDRVESGQVHPYYRAVGHAMGNAFRPDLAAYWADRARTSDPATLAAEFLGRWGRPPERPMDNRGTPPPELRRDPALENQLDANNLLNAPTTWHRTQVLIVQDRTGRVVRSSISLSSGSASLDASAMDAVRRAAATAGAPPARLFGTRPTIESEWAFELGDAVGYVSQAGGTFGGPPGTGGAQVPFGGTVRKRVFLLIIRDAVSHPPQQPPAPAPPAPEAPRP